MQRQVEGVGAGGIDVDNLIRSDILIVRRRIAPPAVLLEGDAALHEVAFVVGAEEGAGVGLQTGLVVGGALKGDAVAAVVEAADHRPRLAVGGDLQAGRQVVAVEDEGAVAGLGLRLGQKLDGRLQLGGEVVVDGADGLPRRWVRVAAGDGLVWRLAQGSYAQGAG